MGEGMNGETKTRNKETRIQIGLRGREEQR